MEFGVQGLGFRVLIGEAQGEVVWGGSRDP